MSEKVFTLDIGTRSVVGLISRQEENKLVAEQVEIIEHRTRSMLDGAIHDIDEVAKVVAEVKAKLEEKTGEKLDKVGVALAGRALQTLKYRLEKEIVLAEKITNELLQNIELEAVSKLLQQLHDQTIFHCVGYSVVCYELDNVKLRQPIGHHGQNLAVEVIATFLPHSVIESMFSVLKKVGLEPISVTLEPIAAVSVIIPDDLKHLNLVLVDVGAGTSDIAITRDGSVVAYGMVPEAGDEITEVLAGKYVLDFTEAEKLKRSLALSPSPSGRGVSRSDGVRAISIQNILGVTKQIPASEVFEVLSEPVETLASHIATEIISLNGEAPQGVILIGGGSLTPMLVEKLAAALGLPPENVGLRGPEKISILDDKTGRLVTPDMVTPVGIAHISSKLKGLRFSHAFVNNKKVQLLAVDKKQDILAALMAAGIDTTRLYGRPGLALTYEYFDELMVVRGELGHPAKILKNGWESSIEDTFVDQDVIEFIPAKDGADAKATLNQLGLPLTSTVTINETNFNYQARVFMNGQLVSPYAELLDRAKLEVRSAALGDVLAEAGYDASAHLKSGSSIKIKLNDQEIEIDGSPGKVLVDGREAQLEQLIHAGAKIELAAGERPQIFLSQVLPYLDIDLNEVKGKKLALSVNGQPAGFASPLYNGAEVCVGFEPLHSR